MRDRQEEPGRLPGRGTFKGFMGNSADLETPLDSENSYCPAASTPFSGLPSKMVLRHKLALPEAPGSPK